MRKEMNTLPLFLLALVVPGGLGLLEHPKHTHTHTHHNAVMNPGKSRCLSFKDSDTYWVRVTNEL